MRQNEPMCLLDPGLSGDVYSGLSRQSRMVCKLWVGVVQLARAQRDNLRVYIYIYIYGGLSLRTPDSDMSSYAYLCVRLCL